MRQNARVHPFSGRRLPDGHRGVPVLYYPFVFSSFPGPGAGLFSWYCLKKEQGEVYAEIAPEQSIGQTYLRGRIAATSGAGSALFSV